jgi:hypothetical protein
MKQSTRTEGRFILHSPCEEKCEIIFNSGAQENVSLVELRFRKLFMKDYLSY